MRAYEYATKEAWAILAHYNDDGSVDAPDLALILNMSQRLHEPDYDAVLKAQAHHLEARESATAPVNGVAQINVIGSIFRYSNLFTQVSGGANVGGLQSDLNKALSDSSTKAILLNIDSPGGQVDGISDLAGSIRAANKIKPVVAFSDGMLASAAYWLGSAASQIVVSDTAAVGSLGVVANASQREKKPGEYEFVSSVSPKKRAQLNSDEGRAQVQAHIDAVADVFLKKVAAYRGVTYEKVIADFGQGGVLIGASAVDAGMADEVGTRDSAVARLLQSSRRTYSLGGSAAKIAVTSRSKQMDLELTAEQTAALNQQIATARAEARSGERTRISGILASSEAEGREVLARSMALDTDLDPEAAKKLLAVAPKAVAVVPQTADSDFAQHMARTANPQVGIDGAEKPTDEQALINAECDRILKAGS